MTDLLVIDGAPTPAEAGERLPIHDPSTGQVVRDVALGRPADAARAIAAARRAFDDGPWPRMAPAERAAVLRRLGQLVEERADDFASLMVDEGGAIVAMAKALHVLRPMVNYRDMVEKGSRSLDEPLLPLETGTVTTRVVAREPWGVVTAIVPWNFPHLLTVWKVGPALVTGNCVILKPALETPSVELLLAELALEAGVPAGVFNVVTGGPDVGEVLVSHPDVDMVTFTGSTAVGRTIGQLAMPTLKHLVLELGGKSPTLVLPDADVTAVAANAMRFVMHSGQGCGLQTRLLLPDELHDEVVDRLVAEVERLTLGSAHDPTTSVGPVISAAQQQRIEGFFDDARAAGAKAVVGGSRVEIGLGGHYVTPTVFTAVDPDSRLAQEEVFGPVLAVIRYSGDPAVGVRIANNSQYGLMASVWTADTAKGLTLARRIRAGVVMVNATGSSIDGPFGGYKQSGAGRELGYHGLHEFTQIKQLEWGTR